MGQGQRLKCIPLWYFIVKILIFFVLLVEIDNFIVLKLSEIDQFYLLSSTNGAKYKYIKLKLIGTFLTLISADSAFSGKFPKEKNMTLNLRSWELKIWIIIREVDLTLCLIKYFLWPTGKVSLGDLSFVWGKVERTLLYKSRNTRNVRDNESKDSE